MKLGVFFRAIVLFFALVISSAAQARPSYDLPQLVQKCEVLSERAELELGHSQCAKKLTDIERQSSEQCLAIQKTYEKLIHRGRQLKLRTLKWLASGPKNVTSNGEYISISLDITRHPDYPLKNSDELVNEALTSSRRSLGLMDEKVRDWLNSECKKDPLNVRFRAVQSDWYGFENDDSDVAMYSFHNRLGLSLSREFLQLRQEIMSTSRESAIEALSKIGITIK